MVKLKKINYYELNSRAKEMYNFHKVSAKLADYGFTSMWLNNDWEGADFIAIHIDGNTSIKVQLKGRLSFYKKYIGKDIYIAFIEDEVTYLYPHDEILEHMSFKDTDKTWIEKDGWSTPRLSKFQKELLADYII